MGAVQKILKKPPKDPEKQLAASVKAWRAVPCAELAALALRVEQANPPPPFTGDGKAWLHAAKQPTELTKSALLLAVRGRTIDDTHDRLEAALEWGPDPRTSRALELMLTDVPFTSDSSMHVWNVVFDGVRASNDARFKTLAGTLPTTWRIRAPMRKTLERGFLGASSRLGEPAVLDAADRAAISTWEAALPKPTGPDRDEAALLAAIFANLADDAPRLVYADWLAGKGSKRGEFIALQLAGNPGAAKLLRKHRDACVGPLAPVLFDEEFARGFVVKARAQFKNDRQRDELASLPNWATIEELEWDDDALDAPAVRHAKRISGLPASVVIASKTPFPYEKLAVTVEDMDEFRDFMTMGRLLPRLRVVEIDVRDPAWLDGVKQSPARHVRFPRGGAGVPAWAAAVQALPIDTLELETSTIVRGPDGKFAGAAAPAASALPVPEDYFLAVAWTAEGWWLCDRQRVVLVDPTTRKILREHTINAAEIAAFTPDGKRLLVLSGGCYLHDLVTGKVVSKFAAPFGAKELRTSSDGHFALIRGENHSTFHDTTLKKQLREVKSRTYVSADVSADGGLWVVPFEEKRAYLVGIYDARPGSRAVKLKYDGGDPRFLPDGRLVVVDGDKLAIHDPKTGTRLASIAGPKQRGICELTVSPDGAFVAAHVPHDLALFDVRAGKMKWVIPEDTWAERSGETPVAFSPDGTKILAGTPVPRVIDVATKKIS